MRRHRKPQEVGRHHVSKLRTSIPLMFDRNDLDFFAEVQGERIEAKSVEELKKRIDEKALGLKDIEWRRVIELKIEGERNAAGFHQTKHSGEQTNGLAIEFERYEIGETASGVTLSRRLAEDLDEWELEQRELDPTYRTCEVHDWSKERHIPYTEERWAALIEISNGLDRARERLVRFFEPKSAAAELDTFTQPQLPAGVEPCDRFDGELARPSVCSRCSRPLEAHDPEVITAAELARQTFEQRQLEQNKRKSRARSGGFTSR